MLAAMCAVAFLRDALLPGRALVPYPPELYDVQAAEAQQRGTLDVADASRGNVAMGDKYNQSLCWDRVLMDRLRSGQIPRWTRDIGGGAAFVPQMAQVYEPCNLLLLLLPSEQWYGWFCLLHQTLFGFCCYLFLRRLECAHASALLGVVCAVLGLWTQSKLHHNVILTAALPLWPMLSSVHALLRDNGGRRRIAALALWTGVAWLSGFAVVALQVSYLTVAFALGLGLGNKHGQRLWPLLRVGGGLALGGMLSLAHMLPVLLAANESARDPGQVASQLQDHGLEWDFLLTACWPDLLCWAGDWIHPAADPQAIFSAPVRLLWSQLVLLEKPIDEHGNNFQNWVECSFSIGLPALACVLLALFDRARRGMVLLFAAVALVGFGIATGKQPFLLLARLMPGIAAADLRRCLFVVAMALVVLAALGADRLLQQRRPWPAVTLLAAVALASTGVAVYLYCLDADAFINLTARLCAIDAHNKTVLELGGTADAIAAAVRQTAWPGEAQRNLAMLQQTALRALLVAGVAGAGLWLRRPWLRLLVLAIATAGELLHTGLGPVQTVPAARVTTPPAVVAPVAAAADPTTGLRPRLARLVARTEARVAAAYPPNLPGFHHLEDASAYNPLPPDRMEKFFLAIEPDSPADTPDAQQKVSVVYHGAGVGSFHDPASLQHPLCDLFGIRFVLTDQQLAAPNLVERTPPLCGRFRLYERTTTLPRATFVRRVELLADRSERLRALARRDRDLRNLVVLEDATAPVPTFVDGPPATVTIVSHADERVELRVDSERDGYLRLADPYDPGWCATIDGESTRVYAADHYLRAVYVPPGAHTVVFTYDGARAVWPLRLSLLTLFGILALLWRRR